MASAVYDNVIVHMGTTAEILWTAANNTHIWALLSTTTGVKTNSHYSDITGQVAAGSGYATGGMYFPSIVVATLASNVCQFDGADCAWTASTFAAAWAHTCIGATLALATSALVTYHDLGGSQSVVAGTLTLQWAGTGVWTITITAAS